MPNLVGLVSGLQNIHMVFQLVFFSVFFPGSILIVFLAFLLCWKLSFVLLQGFF